MRRLLALISVSALLLAVVIVPALAQQQEGLVNVAVTGTNIAVVVPIGIAANVCANVDILEAQQAAQEDETINCQADAEGIATLQQFAGGQSEGPGEGKGKA